MMRPIVLFILCFFLINTAMAQGSDLLTAAQGQLAKKDYAGCVTSYSGLVDQGYQSEDLYYNLAHCYYHNEQLPKAVLYYNKVLKLNEYHADAITNLQIVNDQRASDISILPAFFLQLWWVNLSGVLSATLWGLLALLILAASLYFFWKWLNSPGYRKSYMSKLIITLFFLILVFLLAKSKYQRTFNIIHLVNMEEADLYKGPDKRSGAVNHLIAGERLTILDESNDWYKVVLSNKEIGWINKSVVLGI